MSNGGAEEQRKAEDDRVSAETNRIAAEGNRITAEGERVSAGEARILEEVTRGRGRRRIAWAQAVVYVAIVLLGAFGFYQVDQQNDLRCEEGVELREVLKGQVIAIYELGSQAAQPRRDAQGEPIPRTPTEQRAVDAYLENLKEYRDTQLSKITPSAACEVQSDPQLKAMLEANQAMILVLLEHRHEGRTSR